MREILFRGKRIDNNEWIYGYLCFIYIDGKNKNGFKYTDKACIYCQNDAKNYDVYTKTLGQSTGLIDKNEVKIFEGDIVKIDAGWGGDNKYNDAIAKIVWLEDEACFYEWNINEKYGCVCQDFNYTHDVEVIGNIHDNPTFSKY